MDRPRTFLSFGGDKSGFSSKNGSFRFGKNAMPGARRGQALNMSKTSSPRKTNSSNDKKTSSPAESKPQVNENFAPVRDNVATTAVTTTGVTTTAVTSSVMGPDLVGQLKNLVQSVVKVSLPPSKLKVGVNPIK